MTTDVGAEEFAHGGNLTQGISVASWVKFRQSGAVDLTNLDSNQMWAAVFWGGVGGGYLIYGWRQKAGIPLAGGAVMSLACFLSALPMTVVSIATIGAVYWLMKRGD